MPKKSPTPPTQGRIVIYVWPEDQKQNNNHGGTSPAVVVRTWEDTSYENDEVNLKVLADGKEDMWATSVPYSDANEPNTWHWPPRA